jgi:hypothetical protein
MGSAPLAPPKTPDDRYAVRYDGRILEVEWCAAPDAEGVREALTRASEDVVPRPGAAILFIDRCSAFDPAPAELHAIIQTLAGFMPGFNRHVAVVVEADRHMGTWRRCSVGCDMHGIRLKPFRERASARDWLAAWLPEDGDSH